MRRFDIPRLWVCDPNTEGPLNVRPLRMALFTEYDDRVQRWLGAECDVQGSSSGEKGSPQFISLVGCCLHTSCSSKLSINISRRSPSAGTTRGGTPEMEACVCGGHLGLHTFQKGSTQALPPNRPTPVPRQPRNVQASTTPRRVRSKTAYPWDRPSHISGAPASSSAQNSHHMHPRKPLISSLFHLQRNPDPCLPLR